MSERQDYAASVYNAAQNAQHWQNQMQAATPDPVKPGAALMTVQAANEVLEQNIKRLHGVLARIRGNQPQEAVPIQASVRLGLPPLMDALERQVKLANDLTPLLANLEEFL